MKKTMIVSFAGLLILAVIGTALFFFAPSSLKDRIGLSGRDHGMFGSAQVAEANANPSDYFIKQAALMEAEEAKAVALFESIVKGYDPTEGEINRIREKILSQHGEFSGIENIEATVRAYVNQLKGGYSYAD